MKQITKSPLFQLGTAAVSSPAAFFVGFWPDYEELMLNITQVREYRVQTINLKHAFSGPLQKIALIKKLTQRSVFAELRRLIKQHREAVFFIQDNNKLLRFLLLHPNTHNNLNLFCRDAVPSKPVLVQNLDALKTKGITIWSFNPIDCKQLGLSYYNQFISKVETAPLPDTQSSDLLFVGRDKGRKAKLHQIKGAMARLGYRVNITIRSRKPQSDEDGLMPYNEYLSLLHNTRGIIDINQGGADGLTLRPLEACVYRKKLISDNRELAQCEFYHPDNIYLLGDELDAEEIHAFMQRPFRPVSEDLLSPYLTENVLRDMIVRSSAKLGVKELGTNAPPGDGT